MTRKTSVENPIAKLRKDRNSQIVARKNKLDDKAANLGRRVVEFPKPTAPNDVVSDRIIFEIGEDRFAIKWTAEIERLPLAGPVAVKRKQISPGASN
jgi:hypothetical protein